MEFRILSDEEFQNLSNKDRRDYLKKKKEYDNNKLIQDTLASAKEEEPVIPAPVIETPVEDTTKTEPEVKTEIIEEPVVKEEEPKKAEPAPKKEKSKSADSPKAGRPKGRPSSKISINVPDEFLEYVEIASGIKFKGNTSGYITALIENDINENRAVYDQIKKYKNK